MVSRVRSMIAGIAMLAVTLAPARAAKLPAPLWFGNIVQQHVRSMEKRSYYDQITTDGAERNVGEYTGDIDFFHGHLLRTGTRSYTDLDGFLRDTFIILYHTQEYTEKWSRDRTKPLTERTPRSIIGYRNGTVQPAIDTVGITGLRNAGLYHLFGTVYGYDVAKALNGLDDGFGNYTMIENPTPCVPQYQFYIVPSSHGRYSSKAQRFEVVIECNNPHEAPEPSILLRDPPTTLQIPDPFRIFHFKP